jgi:hypothetical protein
MIKIQVQQINGHHSRHGQLATNGAWGPPGNTQFLPLAAVLAIPIALRRSQAVYWLHQ